MAVKKGQKSEKHGGMVMTAPYGSSLAEKQSSNLEGLHQAAAGKETPAIQEHFPIVGLAGSAGGLEALQDFLRHMPSKAGLAFVVVTHQHPGHPSLLPELLRKCAAMPVAEARMDRRSHSRQGVGTAVSSNERVCCTIR